MAAKDGLLVRLRLTGGMLTAATAGSIADLARHHGNGLIDLSSRGNLQLRGVSEASWPALLDDLRALALLDDDPAAEAIRNVVASPLAGLSSGLDIRPLVHALEAALTAHPALHDLPPKFGFLVDDGTLPSLASVAADVRFDWRPADGAFSIGLGGTRADALRIGTCPADALVSCACHLASTAITLGRGVEQARRFRSLIDWHGVDAVADACGGTRQLAIETPGPAQTPDLVGPWRFGDVAGSGVAAPFGRLDDTMLRTAARHAHGDLRLTPWRTILLPGAAPNVAALASLQAAGFILDPQDARLNVIACVGREGCARGTTPTRDDAIRIAELATAAGTFVHVSGCAKGCAHAASAPITLVGRDGRYDLVRNGRSGDDPSERGLDLAAVETMLTQRVGMDR